MYIKFILILSISILLTLLITPFLRRLALKNGFVDLPNDRKIHANAVPRLGGLAIFASFSVTMWFACVLFDQDRLSFRIIIGIFSCSTIIFMVFSRIIRI